MIKEIEFRAIIAPIMSGIRTGNDGMRLTLDIPESDVGDVVALIALRNCPLTVTIKIDPNPLATKKEKPAKQKREKKPPKPGTSENGHYWQEMMRANWYVTPGVMMVLDWNGHSDDEYTQENYANETIRNVFGVQSRREISPDDLETWAAKHGLDNLISVSRTSRVAAERKAERKANARQTET